MAYLDGITKDSVDYELHDTRLAPNGTAEDIVVGTAKQLESSVGIEDNAPYLFRTAGGSNDIGDREVDKIVGATVAFNQLSVDSNKQTLTNFAAPSTTIAATSANSIIGHVYMLLNVVTEYSGEVPYRFYYDGTNHSQTGASPNVIFKATTDTDRIYRVNFASSYHGTTIAKMSLAPNVCNLTLMFGSAIADAIYAMEQAQAGSGVAFLKSYGFFLGYEDYDAGSLKSVNVTEHKMTGFNQWDEEWELGTLSTTDGSNEANNARIRSKNYIPIIPLTTYFFRYNHSGGGRIAFYDADKAFISMTGDPMVDGGTTFTTPENAYYMRFSPYSTYGTTYLNDICINFHWDGERDGEYEAHEEHTYALDAKTTENPSGDLRGLFKIVNGELVADGDEYTSDGKVARRYRIVDMGTLTWIYDATTLSVPIFQSGSVPSKKLGSDNMVSPWYEIGYSRGYLADHNFALAPWNNSNSRYIAVRDSRYTDVETFKAAMSGVYLVYELEAATEEEATPYTNPQIVNDWGTEEYVDERSVPVPVGHDTFYQANLKAKLEMAPNSPSGAGDYIVRQTNGTNEYVALSNNATIQDLVSKLPDAPTEDGTYVLKATVSSGVATYAWVAEA